MAFLRGFHRVPRWLFHLAILSLDNGHVKHERISTFRQRIILFLSASRGLTRPIGFALPKCTEHIRGEYSYIVMSTVQREATRRIRAILLVRSPLGALTNQAFSDHAQSSGVGKIRRAELISASTQRRRQPGEKTCYCGRDEHMLYTSH